MRLPGSRCRFPPSGGWIRAVLVESCLKGPVPLIDHSPAIADEGSARDFDFLVGRWRVQHRRLDPATAEWVSFEGSASNATIMGGYANVEEHTIPAPNGGYRAVALRSYDRSSGQWAIWWFDERYPSRAVDPPEVGGFENGTGIFYSEQVDNGRAVRVRFIWSNITDVSAQWEQSFSFDGGVTWSPNWIMKFQRDATRAESVAVPQSDFAFLNGEWRVRHRYLRSLEGEPQWMDRHGSAFHQELLGGVANIDEYLIHAPNGDSHALAIRLWDPAAEQWSIWWLDGREPHGPLDPPVRGRFDGDIGTFYGDTTVSGRPLRVRFLWTSGNAGAARWEQAYSADEGGSWQPNWIMEFHRTT